MKNTEDPFETLLTKMLTLHKQKDQDYSGPNQRYANIRVSEEFGIPAWKGALVRLSDKYQRIKQFAASNELCVKDESVEDTLLDLANYALITLILFKEGKPNE